jgi:type II secretory pathway pseudopilin PulG
MTIFEILVGVVIIAALAALVAPVVTDRLREQQLEALATTLDNVKTGILNFHNDVGRYPGRLYMLQKRPSGDPDICGVTIASTLTAKWQGPYLAIAHAQLALNPDRTGVAAADWQLSDTLFRTVGTTTTMDILGINIREMRIADVQRMNTLLDGSTVPPQPTGADTSGLFRWTGASGGATSTTGMYVIPIYGC